MPTMSELQPERLQPPLQQARFEVIADDSLSLRDLIQLQEQGMPVMRSPHIGNASGGNLAWFSLGGRAVLFDRNIGMRDKNYHPHTIIEGGEASVIADEDVLTTHALVRALPSNSAFPMTPGEPVSDVHVRALETVFSSKHPVLQTESDYFLENETVMNEVIAALDGFMPESWRRRVAEDGTVHEVDIASAGVARYGIFRDGNDKTQQQGMLVPNEYNVLLSGIVDALNYQTDTVYHLSGPDMIVYIRQMAPKLDAMYARVKAQSYFGAKLPDHLKFVIVPAAAAKFVVPTNRQAALDAVVQRFDEYEQGSSELQAVKKARLPQLQQDAEARNEFLADCKQAGNDLKSALDEAVVACPDIFAETRGQSYVSQYDLQDGVYVHPRATEVPLSESGRMFGMLQKIHRKVSS